MWKLHIDDVKEKTEIRTRHLKHLAGVKWGCSISTLHANYERPLKANCQTGANRKPNFAAGAGAVKSTLIPAMLANPGEMNIEYDIKISALKLYQKLLRMPHSTQLATSGSSASKLKTQKGYYCSPWGERSYDLTSRLKLSP